MTRLSASTSIPQEMPHSRPFLVGVDASIITFASCDQISDTMSSLVPSKKRKQAALSLSSSKKIKPVGSSNHRGFKASPHFESPPRQNGHHPASRSNFLHNEYPRPGNILSSKVHPAQVSPAQLNPYSSSEGRTALGNVTKGSSKKGDVDMPSRRSSATSEQACRR